MMGPGRVATPVPASPATPPLQRSAMLRPTLLVALALSTLTGCAATDAVRAADAEGPAASASAAPTEAADAEEDDPEAAAEKARKLKREVADLEWKLEQAKLDLESARIQVELDRTEAEAAVADAAVDLQEAILALESYRDIEAVHERDSSQLSLDRAENRAVEAAQELAELQSMYDVEEFAEKTKELVISRGERNLAFAQRSLELQERSHALLVEWELPKKTRALERAVTKAERGAARARTELEKAKLDADKRLRAARHAIDDLERDLVEKREEREELES